MTTGTVDADLQAVARLYWVCEAIVEDLAIKKDLFLELEEIRKDGSVISSNTSGIPLRQISEGMSERFRSRRRTHFFNPFEFAIV